ncbi:unnamed protein product [Ambrosiozyma monospora]|uniref:Unnamed protein product n=1 Tax=Ambrosiozyma monospora TaxID=43982 RepID=A0A9W7DKC3_AMBMO|nr:unnamed protein product [Ambrosiozyma monospora]
MKFFFDDDYFECLNNEDRDLPADLETGSFSYKQVLNAIFLQCHSFIESQVSRDMNNIKHNIYIASPQLHLNKSVDNEIISPEDVSTPEKFVQKLLTNKHLSRLFNTLTENFHLEKDGTCDCENTILLPVQLGENDYAWFFFDLRAPLVILLDPNQLSSVGDLGSEFSPKTDISNIHCMRDKHLYYAFSLLSHLFKLKKISVIPGSAFDEHITSKIKRSGNSGQHVTVSNSLSLPRLYHV